MKKVVIGLALATLLGVAQARFAVPLVEPERVALVSGTTELTPNMVRQAIVRGGATHDWTVASDQPGKLQLKYNKQNKHEVLVDISYDAAGFLIRYAGSTNMKYENKAGVPMIHPAYNTWVGNLSRAITVEATRLSAGN